MYDSPFHHKRKPQAKPSAAAIDEVGSSSFNITGNSQGNPLIVALILGSIIAKM